MIMQTHTEAPTAVPTRRAHSLDALRGYAIMTMILAATEAFGILPAWMYHAQEPPPTHVFNPHIYGITWVDLIFPFFLFSMGAAIPLSLGRQLEKGTGKLKLLKKTIIRWMKLTFFAIFVIHVYPYMLGYPAPWMNELVALAAFALMFLIFMRNPFHLSKWGNRTMNTLAYAAAVALILFQPYAEGKPFMLKDEDIIMLILANVSLTGAVIYLLTPHKPMPVWHSSHCSWHFICRPRLTDPGSKRCATSRSPRGSTMSPTRNICSSSSPAWWPVIS